MEKKTLYELIKRNYKTDHMAIDQLAIKIADEAVENYGESFTPLYRFVCCILFFLAESCRKDDITWTGFFSVVQIEVEDIKDEDYRTSEKKTAFQILMEESKEESAPVSIMYNYYKQARKNMPDDTLEILLDCVENVCTDENIELDLADVDEHLTAHRKKYGKAADAEEKEYVPETDLDFIIEVFKSLNRLSADDFKIEHVEDAWDYWREISDIRLRDVLEKFLTEYEEYNDIHKAAYEYRLSA